MEPNNIEESICYGSAWTNAGVVIQWCSICMGSYTRARARFYNFNIVKVLRVMRVHGSPFITCSIRMGSFFVAISATVILAQVPRHPRPNRT